MAIGARKPPLLLRSAPRFAEVYWVDFSSSNVLPEFDDVHPGIVIRSGQKLDRPHIIVPMTTVDQTGNVFAYQPSVNPNPRRLTSRPGLSAIISTPLPRNV
ncbi:MAG TPA: hypothetical protein PLO65_12255 [Caulobacter sp.]|nr:hypothetical protein [Caulobacter sp.]